MATINKSPESVLYLIVEKNKNVSADIALFVRFSPFLWFMTVYKTQTLLHF